MPLSVRFPNYLSNNRKPFNVNHKDNGDILAHTSSDVTCQALEMGKQLTVNSANAHFMPTKSKQRVGPTPQ